MRTGQGRALYVEGFHLPLAPSMGLSEDRRPVLKAAQAQSLNSSPCITPGIDCAFFQSQNGDPQGFIECLLEVSVSFFLLEKDRAVSMLPRWRGMGGKLSLCWLSLPCSGGSSEGSQHRSKSSVCQVSPPHWQLLPPATSPSRISHTVPFGVRSSLARGPRVFCPIDPTPSSVPGPLHPVGVTE